MNIKKNVKDLPSVIEDLENVFNVALTERNLMVAFKIKELQAKYLDPSALFSTIKNLDIKSLSDQQLAALVDKLKNKSIA